MEEPACCSKLAASRSGVGDRGCFPRIEWGPIVSIGVWRLVASGGELPGDSDSGYSPSSSGGGVLSWRQAGGREERRRC